MTNNMDALIIGGDSQIGKELVRRLREHARTVVATTRKWPPATGMLPFDLRYESWLPKARIESWLPKARITFFCTGMNGFKPCEENPEEARRINVTLLGLAAERVREMGSDVVFLSSAAAETHPDTVYGTCKRDAEKIFLRLGGACFRFGPVAFPGRDVYPNETYSPINLPTLTYLLAKCFEHWEPGLHHIYNRTWTRER